MTRLFFPWCPKASIHKSTEVLTPSTVSDTANHWSIMTEEKSFWLSDLQLHLQIWNNSGLILRCGFPPLWTRLNDETLWLLFTSNWHLTPLSYWLFLRWSLLAAHSLSAVFGFLSPNLLSQPQTGSCQPQTAKTVYVYGWFKAAVMWNLINHVDFCRSPTARMCFFPPIYLLLNGNYLDSVVLIGD